MGLSMLTDLLAFGENLVLTAHPSKTGSDWWYGTIVQGGKSGFFPKTYVEQIAAGKFFSVSNHMTHPHCGIQ